VGSRRSAHRALSSIKNKEESKGGNLNMPIIVNFLSVVEKELEEYCNQILNLIDEKILDRCNDADSKVFFLKMKGDYFRYRSEYVEDATLQKVKEGATQAYTQATDIAQKELKTTNPIRLGLSLNYSVFYYEVFFV
jgi:14-3-3 protein epsilon